MGYECGDCPTGYVGDGEICTCDIAGGYIEYPASSGICIDDPCDPDPCNGHATSCDVNGSSDFTCNCDTNYDGDTCDTCAVGYGNYPVCAEVPTITNIVIDCSNPGVCLSNWTAKPYPVTFDVTNATTCSVVLSLESGTSSLGSTSPCIITGDNGSFDYDSTGTSDPATIRMTITVFGPGGQVIDHADINLT